MGADEGLWEFLLENMADALERRSGGEAPTCARWLPDTTGGLEDRGGEWPKHARRLFSPQDMPRQLQADQEERRLVKEP